MVGQEPGPATRARDIDGWTILLGIIGGALLGTGVTFAILGFVGVFEEPTPPTIPPPPSLTAPASDGPPPTFGDVITATGVAEAVIPSTVFIQTDVFIFSGSGSGVVYGSDGYILTNHHVVDGTSSVFVTFSDGARFPAEVVGSDPVTDLAVLRVDREDVVPIALGTSADLAIGEPAVAVGNPLGLEGGPTVSSGIVSALNRRLNLGPGEELFGLVQTDAPISPGSSGGALVNAEAKLIGITTAVAVSDVGPEGIGFAVPIDIAIGVAGDLIETGTVDHARLGVNVVTARASEGEAQFPVGLLVEGLASDSAYGAAGGQINDVIVELEGDAVVSRDVLVAKLRSFRAGDVVEVLILRSGEDEMTLNVTLGSLDG